ncbi:MAG: cobalamin B12-binding domain-containing protein [Candidatus Marinimicrobia bacterium]|nr:cobalamin B12-binding domain-containing protein [Candidatus Neomarinimicrobiota bacterium]
MSLINEIKDNVVAGRMDVNSPYPPELAGTPGVRDLVRKALDDGLPVGAVLKDGLIAGMEVIGNKFSAGECFVPEMLISARSMKAGLELLEPHLVGQNIEKLGTIIMGTVQGDMHDIGKNLVGMMLEGGGFEVVDIGIDTPPQKFVEVAQEHPKAVIGLSALLTTTMGTMKTTISALRAAGCSNRVIIGGAATSQQFADEISADGFSIDAAKAVPLVKKLLKLSD